MTMEFQAKERYDIDDLRQIVALLRGENGCPWDREQTHLSIRKNMLEETYELLEALDNDDVDLMREELGDVLLQVVFHARLEEEVESFDLSDVITDICKKLVFRHPHVFSDVSAKDGEEAIKNWDAMKKEEKSQTTATETLKAVPVVLPALMRAQKVQQRAAKVGVKEAEAEAVLTQLEDSVAALYQAMEGQKLGNIEHEMGQILLHCANISNFFDLDCENLLTNATEQFITRFDTVEQCAVANQVFLSKENTEQVMRLWKQSKTPKKKSIDLP